MKEGETYWFLDEPYHRAGVERRAVRARVVEIVGKFVRSNKGLFEQMIGYEDRK